MARYKAAQKLYVEDRLINVGQEFESDRPPGKQWIPLDAAAKAKVGDRPNINRRGQEVPLTAEQQAARDEEAAEAKKGGRGRKGKRGRLSAKAAAKAAAKAEAAERAPRVNKRGHKMASPGKSVTQQQTDGEEPTVGAIHDNEEVKD